MAEKKAPKPKARKTPKKKVTKKKLVIEEKEKLEKLPKKMTEAEIAMIRAFDITYEKAESFLHCKHCLKDYQDGKFGQGQAPRDVMHYELGAVGVPFDKDRIIGVVALFCKRCKREVWNSKHLTHLY